MDSLRLWNILFLLVFVIPSSVYAELLIFKTDENGFLTTLTHAESIQYTDRIGEILLKYQWPMCIASKLTEDEKNSKKPCQS